MNPRGFTIVELLIVIVVIAVLATLGLVTFNGVRTRAQAGAIVSDIKAMEKAFMLYKQASGTSTWPSDQSDEWKGSHDGNNPKIKDIIAYNTTFAQFLKSNPNISSISTSDSWQYDNDGDSYSPTGCAGSSGGVNLSLPSPTNQAVLDEIDRQIDGGDGMSCGKIRKSSTPTFLYSLALSQTS